MACFKENIGKNNLPYPLLTKEGDLNAHACAKFLTWIISSEARYALLAMTGVSYDTASDRG